jgi:hypothetical protein
MISVNGSPFVPVPAANFALNGYIGVITGNNALRNLPAYNADSPGYGAGDFIRSSALGAFSAGDTIRIGFLGAWDEFSRGQQPNWAVDNVLLTVGGASVEFATFTVAATGAIKGNSNHPVFYQWERSNDGQSWQAIMGANSTSYTETVDLGDNGDYFRASIYVPGTVLASDAARLVIGINNPPSFDCGPDVNANENAGAVTVTGWASNVSPGPAAFEENQSVSFIVTTDHPEYFSVQPSVDVLGNLHFTPATAGIANISVVAKDNGGTAFGGQDTSPACTAAITIRDMNNCPVAADQAVTVDNGSATITLVGSDLDGDPLTYAISVQPAHGTLSGTPPTVTYTPAAGYDGPDSFSFTVSDGFCADEGTVSINVIGMNECPNPVITVVPPVLTTRTLTATLNGANERPEPVTTPGSGQATFGINGDQLFVEIKYLGLKSPLTVAHIHGPATTEQAGPVLVSLVPPIQALATRAGTIRGVVTVTPEQIDVILSGQTYVNLHSTQFPAGEIRGQLVTTAGPDYRVISPNNTDANVIFDGSTSWDVDGDPLTYAWFEAPLDDGTANTAGGGKKSSSKRHHDHDDDDDDGNSDDDCTYGKVSELTLQYNGDATAMVGVAQKGKAVLFWAILDPGESFTFNGAGKDDSMAPEIAVFVNGRLNAAFDTSGKTPLSPGTWSGDFLVVSGKVIQSGNMCELPPPVITERVQFGDAVVASRVLYLGLHRIELDVSDGACTRTASVTVEVIKASDAVSACSELVNNSSIGSSDKRTLLQVLKNASRDFDRGDFDGGIADLEAFIDKVERTSDASVSPANKAFFITCAQEIIDALP